MARPKKGGDDNRDIIVRVRLTAHEKVKLQSLSQQAGLTPSDFIRARTLQAAPTIRKATPEREIIIKALAELGKQGSNVNQIARALNRRTEQGELIGVAKADIDAALRGISTLTAQLLKLLDNDHGHQG